MEGLIAEVGVRDQLLEATLAITDGDLNRHLTEMANDLVATQSWGDAQEIPKS